MTGKAHEPIWDDDLQAYVDGRLTEARRRAVENYLEEHPETRHKVDAYRAQREALQQRLAFKVGEPIPARLRVANIIERRSRQSRRRYMSIAMAACWLLVGAGLGYQLNARLGPVQPANAPMVADAFSAYRTYVSEVVHPVEVDATQSEHLVQWLSNRLGAKLVAPDLGAVGYSLMGGRLLPANDDMAAMFMYEDESGERLTLYVRADETEETAFRFADSDNTSAFFWKENGFGYVVAGQTERARLMKAAEAVFEQFGNSAGTGTAL